MAPRCPKMAQNGSKMAPRCPKMAQHGSKMAPRWPKMASQEGFKTPQLGEKYDLPKSSFWKGVPGGDERPILAPGLPKIAPRMGQDAPKMLQEASKMTLSWPLPQTEPKKNPDTFPKKAVIRHRGRLPEAPRGSQRLPEVPRGSQRLPEAPRGSQRLITFSGLI